MLEPLIVLTVLNCIFMFSSTVTTCALWYQYQGHRCCRKTKTTQQKIDSKKSKNYTLQTGKKTGKLGLNDYTVVNRSDTNNDNKYKSKKYRKKSKKDLNEQKRSGEKISFSDRLNIMKFNEKAKLSEASQTLNDAKSTVVMEFSTVQKVVQIVDGDSEINSMRTPFKEIVMQKDIMKRDHNDEQNVKIPITAIDFK